MKWKIMTYSSNYCYNWTVGAMRNIISGIVATDRRHGSFHEGIIRQLMCFTSVALETSQRAVFASGNYTKTLSSSLLISGDT